MKIISFCLFFNPGATTLIVYIESNSHVTQEILSGPGDGEVLGSCVKWHQERNKGKTLKFLVLNKLSYVCNNTCSKNVSYIDTAFSTKSFLTHCTALTSEHYDRGEGRVLPYMAYIYGDGFCPLCPKHGVSKGWTTGNNRHGVKMF